METAIREVAPGTFFVPQFPNLLLQGERSDIEALASQETDQFALDSARRAGREAAEDFMALMALEGQDDCSGQLRAVSGVDEVRMIARKAAREFLKEDR